MSHDEPLDFLLARSAALCVQAAVLRDANRRRHEQAEQAKHRAKAAVLRARLYAAAVADLVQTSRALLRDRPPTTLDVVARARLAEDELWRRRLAKQLRARASG
jgi:hypothetical protein